MNSQSIIVENLVKQFGSFTAVNDVSFSVDDGEIFGFLGPNGAGKTTVVKILSGLLKPTSGKATVAGYDVYSESEMIKRNIGYMSQKFSLYDDLTIKENIVFFGGIYGLEKNIIYSKMNELLNKLDIIKLKNTLVGSLPLGWKQKLAFSLSIFHSPRIVFLDEPTGGVDPITRRQFWEMIYSEVMENNLTVFVTTHYLDEAEYCNRISIMSEGRIIDIDSPVNLKNKYNVNSIYDVFTKLARNYEAV